MTTHYDSTNQEYGIRVRVIGDPSYQGPFRAEITCAITGRFLSGAEQCKSVEAATTRGREIARRFYV